MLPRMNAPQESSDSINHSAPRNEAERLGRRSPNLISASRSLLLVVDVQERLLPLIDEHDRVAWNVKRLLEGSKLLGVRQLTTEQYPQGLGPTVAPLRSLVANSVEKRMFSCRECQELGRLLDEHALDQVVVCGLETHVCVQQTVLDLLSDGVSVYVVTDAVGARHTHDHETAVRRMESCGANLTTTESALFEWCESSTHPQFKALSRLIQQPFSSIFGEPDPSPVSPPAES